jgi:hypothetical protein
MTIEDRGRPLAEVSLSLTSDGREPHLTRGSYLDLTSRERLAVRSEVHPDNGAFVLTYEFPESGEAIVFRSDGSREVKLTRPGGGSLIYDEHDTATASVREAASAVLAGASPRFRKALRDFTAVGVEHGTYLRSLATPLQGLWFPDLDLNPLPEGERVTRTVERSGP